MGVAHRARRVPVRALQARRRTLLGNDDAVRVAARGSLAVHRLRACDDDALHGQRSFDDHLVQQRGACGVHAEERREILQVILIRGSVENGVDAVERAFPRLLVAHVAVNEVAIRRGRALLVHGLRQRVEHAHLVAARLQGAHGGRTDEPGAAGHENAHARSVGARA